MSRTLLTIEYLLIQIVQLGFEKILEGSSPKNSVEFAKIWSLRIAIIGKTLFPEANEL